jgi:GDP-4-dehydro-6-deoxy-D-mannose reductase
MPKVLITGITGFVGSHMADLLLQRSDIELYGTRRWSSRMNLLEHIKDLDERVRLMTCNILDPVNVFEVIEKVRPDWIFHFAAESYVAPSWDMPHVYMNTNINGTINFLEALRKLGLNNTRFHVAGSGEEYGLIHEDELPITETTELRPVNPYAVSKVAQDLITYEHHCSYNLHVIRTRAFNHEGPRRDKVFALPTFAYQIARIEAGLQPPVVRVGNIEAKRNWTDVRDMVKAYLLAMQKCTSGEMYLIGSDKVLTVRECLEKLIEMSTSKEKIKIEEDPARMRPTEVPRLIGTYDKFVAATGWKPEIPFEQTLSDTLDYWRSIVRKEQAM